MAFPAGFPKACQPPFLDLLGYGGACTAQLTGTTCADGQTLFDVLDPATFCNAQSSTSVACSAYLPGVFDDADELDCCTLNTLYLVNAGSSCQEDAEYLSFKGLSDTIDYFCATEETKDDEGESSTLYVLTDTQAYVTTTGTAVGGAYTTYLSNSTDEATVAAALAIFDPAVDCTYVSGASCAFKSLLNYGQGCGGASKATAVGQLQGWLLAVSTLCPLGQEISPDFSSVCDGLPADLSACLAENDANCEEGDDDSASSIVTSTLAGLFAAVAGLAAFTRKF